jgi:hypothetical protein
MPTCVTPELEYLQVRWAAHLPFATAARLLGELLPIADAISVSGVKRRVRAVGAALETSAAAAARPVPSAPLAPRGEPANALSALAVDSAWLRHCDPPRWQARHVNVVAGRACFEGGASRVYAYVHNQVSSAAARLDGFLRASGVDPNARVTILTDGAGEFEKAAKGCAQPTCRILDWFHIAMKFKAAENSVFGCKMIEPLAVQAGHYDAYDCFWEKADALVVLHECLTSAEVPAPKRAPWSSGHRVAARSHREVPERPWSAADGHKHGTFRADGDASQIAFGGFELREVNANSLAWPRAWAVYSSPTALKSGSFLKSARDISCGRAS